MLCYKDRAFCASKGCKNKCGRKLTKKDIKDAVSWWGSKDFPICYGIFCDDAGNSLAEKRIKFCKIFRALLHHFHKIFKPKKSTGSYKCKKKVNFDE